MEGRPPLPDGRMDGVVRHLWWRWRESNALWRSLSAPVALSTPVCGTPPLFLSPPSMSCVASIKPEEYLGSWFHVCSQCVTAHIADHGIVRYFPIHLSSDGGYHSFRLCPRPCGDMALIRVIFDPDRESEKPDHPCYFTTFGGCYNFFYARCIFPLHC